MEQGLHLNDKQNDLETLWGSLAPAPPCLHAKKKADYYAKQGASDFFGIPGTHPRISEACWTIMSQKK